MTDESGEQIDDESLIFANDEYAESQQAGPQLIEMSSFKPSYEPTQADESTEKKNESLLTLDRSQLFSLLPTRGSRLVASNAETSLHEFPTLPQRTLSDSQLDHRKRQTTSQNSGSLVLRELSPIQDGFRLMQINGEPQKSLLPSTHPQETPTDGEMDASRRKSAIKVPDTIESLRSFENTQDNTLNDTQVISNRDQPDNDTQVIPNRKQQDNDTQKIHQTFSSTPNTVGTEEDNNSSISPAIANDYNSTQRIQATHTPKRSISASPKETSTAKRPRHHDNYFNDTQRITSQDNHNGHQDTQLIHTEEKPVGSYDQIIGLESQDNRIEQYDDTQRIENSQRESHYYSDTQVINNTEMMSSPSIQNSRLPFLQHLQENTESSGQVVWTSPEKEELSQTQTPNKQILSSPSHLRDGDYSEHNTTGVSLSPPLNNRDGEPTTQVFNTQDSFSAEIEKAKSPDLGVRPVLLSSQHRGSLQTGKTLHDGDLSIISNDDESPRGVFYEDSLFRHRGMFNKRNYVEHSPSESSSELEDIPDDVRTSQLDILTKDGVFSSFKNGHIANGDTIQETEEFHRLEKDDNIAHENDMDTDPDDSVVKVNIPKKRRFNLLIGTQSQEKPTAIHEEELPILDFRSISRSDVVWVFTQFKHFPGRVILPISDMTSLVEFSDGVQLETKHTDMFILDVRIGDLVHTLVKKGTFVVTGLALINPQSSLMTSRSFDTVYLAKKGKHNVPCGEPFPANVATLYMDLSHWALHQTKFQLLYNDVDLIQVNYFPINTEEEQMELAETKSMLMTEGSTRTSPRKLASRKGGGGLFSGMLFFVTSIEENRKSRLSDLIHRNGGVLIDDEIKQFLSFYEDSEDEGRLKIALKQFGDFKFGALLSDGYSRSAKYLQALALGWPILADSFIDQALGDPKLVDQWFVFLLPAGQSQYTNSLKSHEAFEFRSNWMQQKDLSHQLSLNGHFLTTAEVLILEKKQDVKVFEMCQFIFHAFGARTLRSFSTVHELQNFVDARSVLRSYLVYDNEKELLEVLTNKPRTSKKDSIFEESNEFGIVDWEWVVQSVISNHIWPPVATLFL